MARASPGWSLTNAARFIDRVLPWYSMRHDVPGVHAEHGSGRPLVTHQRQLLIGVHHHPEFIGIERGEVRDQTRPQRGSGHLDHKGFDRFRKDVGRGRQLDVSETVDPQHLGVDARGPLVEMGTGQVHEGGGRYALSQGIDGFALPQTSCGRSKDVAAVKGRDTPRRSR